MKHPRSVFFLLMVTLACLAACERPAPPAGDDSPAGTAAAPPRPDSALLVTWSGQVDGLDLIKFREREWWVEQRSHRPAEDVRCRFHRPLRADDFPVVLFPEQGRGRIRIIRQGDAINAFTLLVEVDDTAFGGTGPYRFSVYANPAPRKAAPAFQLFAEVDDDVVFSIRHDRVTAYKISGQPVGSLKYYFARSGGLDPGTDYVLQVIEGRGTVELLPREDEGGEVRIRIQDPAKGSAPYQLALLPVTTAPETARPPHPAGR